MQKFTQKYTVVQLLENVPEGTEYDWKDWPLHVTLADVFAIHWDAPTIIEKLTNLLKNHEPITTAQRKTRILARKNKPRLYSST